MHAWLIVLIFHAHVFMLMRVLMFMCECRYLCVCAFLISRFDFTFRSLFLMLLQTYVT
jgi:hypothetical protein